MAIDFCQRKSIQKKLCNVFNILFIFVCLRPYFTATATNVTVVAGGTAILPCRIEGLSSQTVLWMSPKSNPLVLGFKTVTADQRFGLEQPYPTEWNLRIQDVRLSDWGKYRCTVSGSQSMIKFVLLVVHEPAKIIDKWSTKSPVLSQEGDTINLICNATGVPYPEITWFRITEGGSEEKQRIGKVGEILVIRNVSRDCDDSYQCIAYNGVNPADDKVIKVDVEFAPSVVLPTSLIRQSRNKDVILECESTAHPMMSTVWKFGGDTVTNSYKYRVNIFDRKAIKQVVIQMIILDLEKEDFGQYTCVSVNQLGRDAKTVVVQELKEKPQVTLPTTTTTPGQKPQPTQQPTKYKTQSVRFRPTTRGKGDYKPVGPGNIKGTESIKVVTETPRRGVSSGSGRSSFNQSQRNNYATNSTYAGLALVVFFSAMTSICACRRS